MNKIKIAVGESACFYVLCNSENMYDELVITEENSNLIQVKEISSDQLLYEKKGAELLKNAPSGVKMVCNRSEDRRSYER